MRSKMRIQPLFYASIDTFFISLRNELCFYWNRWNRLRIKGYIYKKRLRPFIADLLFRGVFHSVPSVPEMEQQTPNTAVGALRPLFHFVA